MEHNTDGFVLCGGEVFHGVHRRFHRQGFDSKPIDSSRNRYVVRV